MNKQDLIMKLVGMLLSDGADALKSDRSADRGSEWDHYLKGKPVIIRARDAGVHFGYLKHFEGRVVTLEKARRMHRWWSKTQMSLSAVAEFGLNEDKPIRICVALQDDHLILDACEIIPCTPACVASFDRVEPYNEQ